MTHAIFHPSFRSIGGAEIHVTYYARALQNAGLDVSVVTLAFDRARWEPWFGGIPVHVVEKPPWTHVFGSYLSQLKRTVDRAEDSLRACDTVLAFNFPANVLLGASSVSGRRAWYCTEPSRYWHMIATNPRLYGRVTASPGGDSFAERDFAKSLAKHLRLTSRPSARTKEIAFDIESTKKLDTIIAITEFGRDNVRRVYGRNDMEVIPPIVRFPPQRASFRSGLRRDGLKVLTHSRLEIPKNIDNVVRGFALFSSKVPRSELHVVGEGSQRKRLERLAQRLGVGESVRFHGYVPEKDLDAVYDACDVFALTTLDEPFGLVYPEAAARGLLLVGPDHGGPFEILDGGRLGWICDPFAPEALAEALNEIWALGDAEVDARRVEVDRACRSRYSEATIGPRLFRALRG
jgi:glycosyltransferase involved in cell wall biosynthesis